MCIDCVLQGICWKGVSYLALAGDPDVRWFSYDTSVHVERPQMACHLTHTTSATHKLIRDHLHETPVYG
jgi:tRNA uridine 5-carboxymethylaminomethyl modification enzyme